MNATYSSPCPPPITLMPTTMLTRSRRKRALEAMSITDDADNENISMVDNRRSSHHSGNADQYHKEPRTKRRKMEPSSMVVAVNTNHHHTTTNHHQQSSTKRLKTENAVTSVAIVQNNGLEDPCAQQWLQQAQDGQVSAMRHVGHRYLTGTGGFPRNETIGYAWLRQAHEAGDIWSTARVGLCLVQGIGVTQNHAHGILHLTLAASRGSDVAMQHLGMALADGLYGLPVDRAAAMPWLTRALCDDCPSKHLNAAGKRQVRVKLQQIQQIMSMTTLDKTQNP